MENAADALVMAGCVLVFIIALSICMSSLSELRQGIDDAINEPEYVDLASYLDSNNEKIYINYIKNSGTTRIVGAETVLSSMYRALKENNDIYLKFINNSDNNDLKNTLSGISLEVDNDINGEQILKFSVNKNDDMFRVIDSSTRDLIIKMYKKISDKKFGEFLGEYKNKSEVESENKMTKRIITYVEQP